MYPRRAGEQEHGAHSGAARWTTTALVFAALCLAPPALGAQHAVPLPENFDAGKCVECHEDKTKGKAVHSAMALGCDSCHEVKTANNVTTVSLTAASPLALCLTCHSDKAVAEAKGPVHPPVAQNCITCHSPHASKNGNQLVKPASGDKGANLCLQCHTQGVEVAGTGSRHAALDAGCDTCHLTHKTGPSTEPEFRYHLVKRPPAVCLDCHDAQDKQLATAHSGQPFARAACTGCHDPHQSVSPKLLQANVHLPFGEKMCDACHQQPKDGKVVLVGNGAFALCYTCHDDKQKQITQSKTQHGAFNVLEACTECHNPHATRAPKLVKADQGQLCATCHERSMEKVLHLPYAKGQCALCHDPHGAELPYLTRTEPAKLCAGCHVEQLEIKPDEKLYTVTLPWNQAISLEEYARASKIGLDSGNRSGHPVGGHPITGKNTKGSGEISCLTCHQPHSSRLRKLMAAGVKTGLDLCARCHKEAGL